MRGAATAVALCAACAMLCVPAAFDTAVALCAACAMLCVPAAFDEFGKPSIGGER